jgi:hypothetical protein
MTIASTAHLGGRIAEALKLDLKYIKRITLDFDVDSAIVCKVEFYPDITQVDSVTNMLELEMKHYALIELQQTKDVVK